jgi:hypothetical protein
MRGGDYEDDSYRGIGFVKRVLEVPARVGSLFQEVGRSMIRNFPEG